MALPFCQVPLSIPIPEVRDATSNAARNRASSHSSSCPTLLPTVMEVDGRVFEDYRSLHRVPCPLPDWRPSSNHGSGRKWTEGFRKTTRSVNKGYETLAFAGVTLTDHLHFTHFRLQSLGLGHSSVALGSCVLWYTCQNRGSPKTVVFQRCYVQISRGVQFRNTR